MNLHIEFSAALEAHSSTPAVFMIEAASDQVLQSNLTLSPFVEAMPLIDAFGNPCRRLLLPAGQTEIQYKATVTSSPEADTPEVGIDPDILTLPAEVLQYTLPSRYCPSDRLEPTARDLFGSSSPGLARVQDICEWINRHIEYEYGTSDAFTTAVETLLDRKGVCRDFAHLAISFCRALSIPARYVSGYCLGLETPDLHAFFEAYVGGRWVEFDATSAERRPALVRIGRGFDAASCAWLTAYGQANTKHMNVIVAKHGESSLAA